MIQPTNFFGARLPQKLHPTSKGTETLATLFHQLHHCLEGKEIPIGDIPKLDIPLKYFSDGILPHSLG
jgi:hypothetical protein